MKIGLIGLGRMGVNMARRVRRAGLEVVVWNRNHDTTQPLVHETGVVAAIAMTELVGSLDTPRMVWLMLPAGAVTAQQLAALLPLLSAGDLVIDGANSYDKDS